MNMSNKEVLLEEKFDEFYESKKAQDFCFGNYNNATRDESVGRFSFEAGWDAGLKSIEEYFESDLEFQKKMLEADKRDGLNSSFRNGIISQLKVTVMHLRDSR